MDQKPMSLVTFDEHGNIQLESETLQMLRSIQSKITVIGIVGKYRTGKSYLMNMLWGSREGFDIDHKRKGSTKGIWILPQKHPSKSDEKLLFLDTEDLYDQKKDNVEHIATMFCMLVCDILINNTQTSLEGDIPWIQKLSAGKYLGQILQKKCGDSEEITKGFRERKSLIYDVRCHERDMETMKWESSLPDEYQKQLETLKTDAYAYENKGITGERFAEIARKAIQLLNKKISRLELPRLIKEPDDKIFEDTEISDKFAEPIKSTRVQSLENSLNSEPQDTEQYVEVPYHIPKQIRKRKANDPPCRSGMMVSPIKVANATKQVDEVKNKLDEEICIKMAYILYKGIRDDLLSNRDIVSSALDSSEMKLLVETEKGKIKEVHSYIKRAMEIFGEKCLEDFTIDDLVTIREADPSLVLKEECMPSVILKEGERRSTQTLGVLLEDPEKDTMLITTTNHGKIMTDVDFQVHFFEGKHAEGKSFSLGKEAYSNHYLPEPLSDPIENLQDFTAIKLTDEAKQKYEQNSQQKEAKEVIIHDIYEEEQPGLLKMRVQKVGSSTKLSYGVVRRVCENRTIPLNGKKICIQDTIITELDKTKKYPSIIDEEEKLLKKALTTKPENSNNDLDDSDEDDVGSRFTKRGDSGAVITTLRDGENKVQAISTHAYSFKEGDDRYSVSIPLKRSVDEMNEAMGTNATIYPTRISNPTEICFGIGHSKYQPHPQTKQEHKGK